MEGGRRRKGDGALAAATFATFGWDRRCRGRGQRFWTRCIFGTFGDLSRFCQRRWRGLQATGRAFAWRWGRQVPEVDAAAKAFGTGRDVVIVISAVIFLKIIFYVTLVFILAQGGVVLLDVVNMFPQFNGIHVIRWPIDLPKNLRLGRGLFGVNVRIKLNHTWSNTSRRYRARIRPVSWQFRWHVGKAWWIFWIVAPGGSARWESGIRLQEALAGPRAPWNAAGARVLLNGRSTTNPPSFWRNTTGDRVIVRHWVQSFGLRWQRMKSCMRLRIIFGPCGEGIECVGQLLNGWGHWLARHKWIVWWVWEAVQIVVREPEWNAGGFELPPWWIGFFSKDMLLTKIGFWKINSWQIRKHVESSLWQVGYKVEMADGGMKSKVWCCRSFAGYIATA